jgi:hypothetical protein
VQYLPGPHPKGINVKPQNLVVVIGLLDLVLQVPDLFVKEAGAHTRSLLSST